MNTLEQFIEKFEPRNNDAAVFRYMLDKAILELTSKKISQVETVATRDYFAGKMLIHLVSDKRLSDKLGGTWADYLPRVTGLAYEYADSMIEARKQ